MPLAGAAEVQSLTNDSLKQILNQKIGNDTNINQNLTGMSNEEIAKFQEWLQYRNFNTSIANNNLAMSNLTIGATGENVVALQTWLKEHNFYAGEIDGQFGNATEQAVKLFQNAIGITEDGWAGIETLKAMEQFETPEQGTDSENLQSDVSKVNTVTSSKTGYSGKTSEYSYKSSYGGKGTGDCWVNSNILYNQLASAGTKARIVQYSTSLSPRHRSVQVYKNGAWVDYNYSGYATRYHATKKKPGMTVVK